MNVALLAQCTFAAVQACDIAAGRFLNQNKESYKKFLEEADNEEDNAPSALSRIKNLFKTLECYPKLILFIYNVEDLINEHQEFLAVFTQRFNQFRRINDSIYLIGSTTNANLYNHDDIRTIMNVIRINLPSFNLRRKIIEYYCHKNQLGREYAHKRKPDRRGIIIQNHIDVDVIATQSRNYSGSELKDLIESVKTSVEDDIPNDEASLLWMRIASNFDFKDKKIWSSIALASFYILIPLEILADRDRNSIENYFFVAFKARQNMNIDNNNKTGDLFTKIGTFACTGIKKLAGKGLVFLINSEGLGLPEKLLSFAIATLTQTKLGQVITNSCLDNVDAFMQNKSEFYKNTKHRLKNTLAIEREKHRTIKELRQKKLLSNLVDEAKKTAAVEVIKEIATCEIDAKARQVSELYKKKKEREEINIIPSAPDA